MIRALIAALLLLLCSRAIGGPVDLRDSTGEQVLNGILTDDSFWNDASRSHHKGQLYDEIRLKRTENGYVPMITGEGDQDYDRSLISDVVFLKNTHLPKHMDGAKAIVHLGSGFDEAVGLPYRDAFYVLDMTVMYVVFPQRMYRQHDPASQQTVLAFEKLNPSFVSRPTWEKYQHTMAETIDSMKRRAFMNGVVEADTVYGMFVVEPGNTHSSRVTFVSKIGFEKSGGWVARLGSQLPSVLKSGLKSGFGASVRVAREEKRRQG
jgi:hypothetical protein